MITREQYNLILLWAESAPASIIPPGRACLSTGVAGIVVMSLPVNHVIFSVPDPKKLAILSPLIDNYCGEIVKLLGKD